MAELRAKRLDNVRASGQNRYQPRKCVKTGVGLPRWRVIPIKKHGRRAWSLFALNLGAFRKFAASDDIAQIIAFLQQFLSPKLSVNQLKFIRVRKGVDYDAHLVE